VDNNILLFLLKNSLVDSCTHIGFHVLWGLSIHDFYTVQTDILSPNSTLKGQVRYFTIKALF